MGIMALDALHELHAEIARNVDHLRAELGHMDDPDAAPPESCLTFRAYQAIDLNELDGESGELATAFYRSLSVVLDGHPGFLDADRDQIDRSYRIVLEAAIDLGDQLVDSLADQA